MSVVCSPAPYAKVTLHPNVNMPPLCVPAAGEMNNGVKKENPAKENIGTWNHDELKMHAFSHSPVRACVRDGARTRLLKADVCLYQLSVAVQNAPGMRDEDEPEEEEEEELGHAETYAEYMPMKCTYGQTEGC